MNMDEKLDQLKRKLQFFNKNIYFPEETVGIVERTSFTDSYADCGISETLYEQLPQL